ncbi:MULTISPECIES: AraC family transcriptional regulator [Brucella/Ochrobactrum group]|uniref:AraC family transcriptional regulator n=1 Tax=Brucella/Ochrobactrum group TaxID=2826938 RepID=UPI001C03F14A|nr:helix-turn-helix transcriptional regulator [Brucella sp. NBRC 12950]QWK81326.1 helix-turn-helix transcriptional regulator [Ochrobactrum sp. BTU1]
MSLSYPPPVRLAVTAIAQDDTAFSRTSHRHEDAQLIYARSGIVTVSTKTGHWVVPPNRAVWVPAMIEHATRSHGPVEFRTLFIRPEAIETLPSICGVVEVSPLLRELILRMIELQVKALNATPFAQRVCELLLEELTFLPTEPLNLPMPTSQRLSKLCFALEAEPNTTLSIEEAAAQSGMSRRSFMRHFERETGMTYGRWRQQLRMLKALPQLAAREPIVSIALDCGYQSASAFSATFKRSLGRLPSDYFNSQTR